MQTQTFPRNTLLLCVHFIKKCSVSNVHKSARASLKVDYTRGQETTERPRFKENRCPQLSA